MGWFTKLFSSEKNTGKVIDLASDSVRGIVGFTVWWAAVGMVLAILGEYEQVDAMLKVSTAFNMGVAFTAVIALYFGVQFIRK